jgi:hypothetical protein
MAQLIDICNRALAQIAAGQIADFAEGNIEAREVNRFAKPLLAELAEWAPWLGAGARGAGRSEQRPARRMAACLCRADQPGAAAGGARGGGRCHCAAAGRIISVSGAGCPAAGVPV